MERGSYINRESLNRDFAEALELWQKDNSFEAAAKINELIDRGGGDYADFVLSIPAKVIEKPNGAGRPITLELAKKYGKKEGKVWVFDIHGHRALGIKVVVNQEPHFLALKHKGDGPIGYFKGSEISSIKVV